MKLAEANEETNEKKRTKIERKRLRNEAIYQKCVSPFSCVKTAHSFIDLLHMPQPKRKKTVSIRVRIVSFVLPVAATSALHRFAAFEAGPVVFIRKT